MAFYRNKNNKCIAPDVVFWLVLPLQNNITHYLNLNAAIIERKSFAMSFVLWAYENRRAKKIFCKYCLRNYSEMLLKKMLSCSCLWRQNSIVRWISRSRYAVQGGPYRFDFSRKWIPIACHSLNATDCWLSCGKVLVKRKIKKSPRSF